MNYFVKSAHCDWLIPSIHLPMVVSRSRQFVYLYFFSVEKKNSGTRDQQQQQTGLYQPYEVSNA